MIISNNDDMLCAGNAVQYEWRSTGVCTNQLLSSTSDTVSLYLESGGSSDCIQVGSYYSDHILTLILRNIFVVAGDQLEVQQDQRPADPTKCSG